MRPDFVHLHVHTHYSLRNSLIQVSDLIDRAAECGMRALAVTDHGNMHCAIEFYLKARQRGIRPIIGCEAYLAPASRFSKEKVKGQPVAYHVVLLAMNNTGYRNLVGLLSVAHREGYYYVPRIDRDILKAHNEGLICLTSCAEGEIPKAIVEGDIIKARLLVEEYLSIFGNRLYLELQDTGLEEQKRLNTALLGLAKHFAVPVVATGNCHYLYPDEAETWNLHMPLRARANMVHKRDSGSTERQLHFKSAAEMAHAFAHCPEALVNSVAIAERCETVVETGMCHFPDLKLPDETTPEAFLEKQATEGLHRKLAVSGGNLSEQYQARFSQEIEAINQMGYAPFFLIVSDLMHWARTNGITVDADKGPLRGSLIAHCIGAIDNDPVLHPVSCEPLFGQLSKGIQNVSFEVEPEKENEIIQYLMEKYGTMNVADVIAFKRMGARRAVSEMGKALKLSPSELSSIAKDLRARSPESLNEAMHRKYSIADLYHADRRIHELLDRAVTIEGLVHSASIRSNKVAIVGDPFSGVVPLCRGYSGEMITQYASGALEKIGILRITLKGRR